MKNGFLINRKILRAILFIVVGLLALWAFVLRPVAPRSGPTPLLLNDAWGVSPAAKEGFNDAALTDAVEPVLKDALNVHSILIARHGNIVAEYYQGGYDRSVYSLLSMRHSFDVNQLNDVRSVGKSITGLLYGIALQQGLVPPPDTLVFAQYPALNDIATPEKKTIRIKHLLSMSSGLNWQEGGTGLNDELRMYWKNDLVRHVLSHDLIHTPGSTYHYNGGGTAILADLIARGAQMSFKDYARKNLFAPLGINDWEWVADLHGRAMPFNGLRMRPRDLLKIGQLILNHGRWQGRQVVPEAWLATSFEPRFATGESSFQYGYQWRTDKINWQGNKLSWYGAFGNGGQRLFIVPELDLIVVTNAGAYDELATAIRVNQLLQNIVASIEN